MLCRDLSRDAELLVVVWSVELGAVGGARVKLFDHLDRLRQGLQKLPFQWIDTRYSYYLELFDTT